MGDDAAAHPPGALPRGQGVAPAAVGPEQKPKRWGGHQKESGLFARPRSGRWPPLAPQGRRALGTPGFGRESRPFLVVEPGKKKTGSAAHFNPNCRRRKVEFVSPWWPPKGGRFTGSRSPEEVGVVVGGPSWGGARWPCGEKGCREGGVNWGRLRADCGPVGGGRRRAGGLSRLPPGASPPEAGVTEQGGALANQVGPAVSFRPSTIKVLQGLGRPRAVGKRAPNCRPDSEALWGEERRQLDQGDRPRKSWGGGIGDDGAFGARRQIHRIQRKPFGPGRGKKALKGRPAVINPPCSSHSGPTSWVRQTGPGRRGKPS